MRPRASRCGPRGVRKLHFASGEKRWPLSTGPHVDRAQRMGGANTRARKDRRPARGALRCAGAAAKAIDWAKPGQRGNGQDAQVAPNRALGRALGRLCSVLERSARIPRVNGSRQAVLSVCSGGAGRVVVFVRGIDGSSMEAWRYCPQCAVAEHASRAIRLSTEWAATSQAMTRRICTIG